MTAHYYLSEMAVSDRHGGGLTLQRVVEDGLYAFRGFVHVHDFAVEAPVAERYPGRSLELWADCPPPNFARRSPRSLADRAVTMAGLPSALEQWSERAAQHIEAEFPLEGSQWLVAPQGKRSVLVMNALWRRRPVDYITWVMDDHVVRWENGWRYPLGFEKQFAFHLRNARKVFVISPAMGEFYRARFGVETEVLFGPSDPVNQPPVMRAPGSPLRLAYFGAITRWQHGALLRLAKQMESQRATLDLFGLQAPPSALMLPGVAACPAIPAAQVLEKMREYDGVVIAAGSGAELRNMTELNIATKMAECLASGTVPVIAAPAYAAMARFAEQHGGALVMHEDTPPGVLQQLTDNQWRARVLEQARATVERECSTRVMRERWNQAWRTDSVETTARRA